MITLSHYQVKWRIYKYMLKKEFKKTSVQIRKGYGSSVIIDVYDTENNNTTIARIHVEDLEQFIACRVRGGLFKFSEKGRKYQYITLK